MRFHRNNHRQFDAPHHTTATSDYRKGVARSRAIGSGSSDSKVHGSDGRLFDHEKQGAAGFVRIRDFGQIALALDDSIEGDLASPGVGKERKER